ncbi:hypothetical protein [Arthrobacter crystallopoietes]|uniref:hypothetical protein n=1 Tax=Crystallibacter crystallopoietes TaxID=37928 RepID=UPI001ABDDF2F|nr:hypothetical protein [Arthrobacter crystallopoietes]QTG81688.1 hypothetical protein J5251_03555 [Arthrobacter crystallopoietes]
MLNTITPSSYNGFGVMLAALCIFTSVFHLLKDWHPRHGWHSSSWQCRAPPSAPS